MTSKQKFKWKTSVLGTANKNSPRLGYKPYMS